jgi:uncharacterized protein
MTMEHVSTMIKEGNIEGMRELLESGFDPNQPISVYDSPLDQALDYRQFDIAQLLIEKGTRLPDDIFVSAAKGDRAFFEYLLSVGANVNAINDFNHSALSRALAFDNMDGAYSLIEMGIDWALTGGHALIESAYKGHNGMVALLVERGVDANFYIKDQVFNSGATPILAAVMGSHLEIVKYLLSKGADLSFTDQTGIRAYNYARLYGSSELAAFIKLHEPPEYHDYSQQTDKLISGGLPVEVIESLGTTSKRIEFDGKNCDWLILGTIYDVVRFEYYGLDVYNLLLDLDGFDAFGVITWCPSRNMFISIDMEHDAVMLLHDMTWDAFLANPGDFLYRILEGFYDEEELEFEE